jgi:hypothetical protein
MSKHPIIVTMKDGSLWMPEVQPLRSAGDVEGHPFHGNQWTSGAGAAPKTFDAFRSHAQANLTASSRTAKGVSDTSVSVEKPKLSVEGDALTAKAAATFEQALQQVWDAREKPLKTPQQVEALVTSLARTVNEGLLKPGQGLERTWMTNYPSTDPKDIPQAMQAFYSEFARRLTSDDPVATAAWVERTHEKIHPWADGVGRVTKALAYVALLHGGHALPTYQGREAYYANINKSPAEWERYYRTLFS